MSKYRLNLMTWNRDGVSYAPHGRFGLFYPFGGSGIWPDHHDATLGRVRGEVLAQAQEQHRKFLANVARQGNHNPRVRGLVDGLLGAAQFGGEENLAVAFSKCLNGMTSIEIEALVDKYLADHPALWRRGMHALVANAITESCPEYSKELQKSDFWRRAQEQSKAPK